MPNDFNIDGTISTAEEFQAALGELLSVSTGNGFVPEGSWEYRSDGMDSDWEVMVVELEKQPADE